MVVEGSGVDVNCLGYRVVVGYAGMEALMMMVEFVVG